MVFSSPLFLFGFLPIFLALYAMTPRRAVNVSALIGSVFFYAWGEPAFVFVAMSSALLDLLVVRRLAAATSATRRRALLTVGVASNLGLLVYFKYANFAYANATSLVEAWFGLRLPVMHLIALPIGISFIVFEKITYIVDVYRGVGRPAQRIGDYLLYVFLFPKLLAGPIIKYHDIAGQLLDRPRGIEDLSSGLTRFAFGLAKKVLLADPMGELADLAFSPGGGALGFGLAWMGALAYALQIFFDFSGYSDMAIGLARMMGFRLMENFNRPYLAIGFGDFWRRWHISLSSWIRDYLYIPLGGERVSRPRLYLNLWICFLASGLWHGAAWNFVFWGAYHGLFLTLDRLFLRRILDRSPRALAVAFTFLAVTIGWVLFRAPDGVTAASYLKALVDPFEQRSRMAVITLDLYVTMGIGLAICFLPGFAAVGRRMQQFRAQPRAAPITAAIACGLLVVSIAKAVTASFHPFLYFRF